REQELEVAEVAMTERVVVAESLRQRRLDGEGDILPDARPVPRAQVGQRAQARETNSRGAVTPGRDRLVRCLPDRRPGRTAVAQVEPVSQLRGEQRALVRDGGQRGLPEPVG